MKNNAWLKLAVFSFVGLMISVVLLNVTNPGNINTTTSTTDQHSSHVGGTAAVGGTVQGTVQGTVNSGATMDQMNNMMQQMSQLQQQMMQMQQQFMIQQGSNMGSSGSMSNMPSSNSGSSSGGGMGMM